MTMRVAIAFAALFAVSCGSTAVAPSPTASATSSPVAVPTPTPSQSPASRIVPFPDLTFLVGTNAGDLYFQIKDGQPAGRKVHVCADAVRHLVAYGRRAAFVCGPPGAETLYVYDDATGTTAAVVKSDVTWPGLAFTITGGLVYATVGTTVPTAPIPMTRLMLLDLKTGATSVIDERFGVAFDVRLTSGGVAIWRPQNSLSFRRSVADSGTWLLRDKTLEKLSLHRLIDGYPGRYLLESEPVDSSGFLASGSNGTSYVVLQTDRETRLTPPDVPNEQGVALLPDGRIFTWRPQNGPFEGMMVVYQDGAIVRQDRGKFSPFDLLHTADWTTHTADWVIGTEISGPPATTYRAYRFSDGAFASIPAGIITSLAFLGPIN
jgi:hypothetical protein